MTSGEIMPDLAYARAITYMHNLKDALYTFLDNPYFQPDNGESEVSNRRIHDRVVLKITSQLKINLCGAIRHRCKRVQSFIVLQGQKG